MKIIDIKYPNTKLLESFIANAGSSLKQFKYFEAREIDIIRYHICTCVLVADDEVLAYGHLDEERGIVWLGVAVAEKHTGKGYGNAMMDELIKVAHKQGVEKIKLSVDNTNTKAIKLFEKFNFKQLANKEKFSFYELVV